MRSLLDRLQAWSVISTGFLILGRGEVTAEDVVVKKFDTGQDPLFMDFDDDNNAWVTLAGQSSVAKLSNDGVAIGTYPVGSSPHGIAVHDSSVWVANSADGDLQILDRFTGESVSKTHFGGWLQALRINPRVDQAWLGSDSNNNVIILNLAVAVLASVHLSEVVYDFAFENANNNGWATSTYANAVFRITQGTWEVSEPLGKDVLQYPFGIAIDSSDKIWIVSSGNNRLVSMSTDGNVLNQFGTGTISYGMTIGNNGHIWVASYGGSSVWEYDSTGTFLNAVSVGDGPQNMGKDQSGNIWTANWDAQTLSKIFQSPNPIVHLVPKKSFVRS